MKNLLKKALPFIVIAIATAAMWYCVGQMYSDLITGWIRVLLRAATFATYLIIVGLWIITRNNERM